METAEEKLAFLNGARLRELTFEEVQPDAKNNWINLSDNDFHLLVPVASKDVKSAKTPSQEQAIFKLFSLGVVTARDDWVYDDDSTALQRKVCCLIDAYNADLARLGASLKSNRLAEMLDTSIKWTRAVKAHLRKSTELRFDPGMMIPANYRPYTKRLLYFNAQLNEVQYRLPRIFGSSGSHRSRTIIFTDPTAQKPFMVLAVDQVYDLHFVGAAAGAVGLPFKLESAEDSGGAHNVTDWSLILFKRQYSAEHKIKKHPITKQTIFHYVYAVLHDPIYREKYALNFKREFPHIPFYKDFWQWAEWGKELIDLHIGYESVTPAKLKRTDCQTRKRAKPGSRPSAY